MTAQPLVKDTADLVRSIVRYPAYCDVKHELENNHLDIFVIPHRADYKIVNGRQGRVIQALKELVRVAGANQGLSSEIHLEEGRTGDREPAADFVQDPAFRTEVAVFELKKWLNLLFCHTVQFTAHRDNDLLVFHVGVNGDNDSRALVAALSNVFYAYGWRKGCIIKVEARKQ